MILKGTSPYKIQSIVYKRYFDLDQSGGPTNRTSSCPTLTLVRKQNANSGLLFLLSSVNNQGATMSSSKKMGTPTCYAECSLYKAYSLFISFACQDGSKLVIKFLEAPDLGLFFEAPTETHHYTKCHNVTISIFALPAEFLFEGLQQDVATIPGISPDDQLFRVFFGRTKSVSFMQ